LLFDQNAQFFSECAPPLYLVTVYIVLLNPSFSDLSGWEAAVHSTNDLFAASQAEVFGGGVNSGSGMEFMVSFDTPLATAPVVPLASFQFLPLEFENCLYLSGVSSPSQFGPNPIVWPARNTPVPIETSDFVGNGVEAATGSCPRTPEDLSPLPCSAAVSTTTRNWGALKSRYR